jgi:integrase
MGDEKRRRDGAGSIFQRADGMWVAQVRTTDPLAGTSKPVRRYSKTRAGARDALDQLRADPTRPPAATGPTFADYLRTWTTERLPRTSLSPSTRTMYADVLTWYGIPAAGTVRLSKVTPAVAEAWLEKVAATPKKNGDPLSPSTVRKVYNAAVKALDTAVRDKAIPSNPLRAVDRPKVARVPVPVATADHTDAAIEATKDMRIGPLVVLVAYTGMRVGEALGLRWADLDLDAGTATIWRSGHATAATKTERVRTITLLPEAVAALKRVRARQRSERLAMGAGWQDRHGLVFTTGTGTPIDPHNARRDLQSALQRAGLETGRPWHAFRHGLATRLLGKGVPMPLVSAILGHSGIQITVDTYGHLDAAIPAAVLAEALR